jgi:hypothetical protein
MIHLHRLSSPNRIAQTLKCLTIKKTLKIGKNGVKEDLMVSLDVDKLSQKICQMQPINLIVLIDKKPLGTYIQCVSEGPENIPT